MLVVRGSAFWKSCQPHDRAGEPVCPGRESASVLSAPPRYLQALICTRRTSAASVRCGSALCATSRRVDPSGVFSQDISIVTVTFRGEVFAALRLTGLWITEGAACMTTGQHRCVLFGDKS